MNILPLNKSPNIAFAGALLIIVLALSLLTSIILEPLMGDLEANIASLVLNFVLSALLILIYTSMARDQEYQTQLMEQQKKIMETNHLPQVDIEPGFEGYSEDLSPYEVKIKNRGNSVALHPAIAINPHPADISLDPDKLSDWEPIYTPIYDEKGEPIRRIEPGESYVAESFRVDEHWPCTDSHVFEIIENQTATEYNISGIYWQIIVVFDTMIPTSGQIYRIHNPWATFSEDGGNIFENCRLLYNYQEVTPDTSLMKPGTYDEGDVKLSRKSYI
jgi:hypothetical protein